MPPTNPNQIFVATETFSTTVDGEPVSVTKGVTRVRDGHELIRNNPQFFKAVGDGVHYELEQATDIPGVDDRAAAAAHERAQQDALTKQAADEAAALKNPAEPDLVAAEQHRQVREEAAKADAAAVEAAKERAEQEAALENKPVAKQTIEELRITAGRLGLDAPEGEKKADLRKRVEQAQAAE